MDPAAASSEQKPRRRWLGCLFALTAIVVLGLAAAGLGGALLYDHVMGTGSPGTPVRLVIPEGASGAQIAELLTQQRLIEHPLFFRAAARLAPAHKPIQAGAYMIPSGLTAREILELLEKGPGVGIPAEVPPENRVTVPEGLSVAQASRLFRNPQAFLDAASDPALIAKTGLSVKSLEGFLMPDTYFFDKPPAEREVVERMLDQFLKTYAALLEVYPQKPERGMLEVVTVASLVEEEAKTDEERPVIAAVLYNRIAKKMTLDIDATLQYATGKYGQRLLDRDKEADSPYNTYKHPGLPPGPIASPGKASLAAALAPAKVDYLYFVSNADGHTHTFSASLAEHQRAVARFRKEIAVQRRQQREQTQNGEQQPTAP